MTRRNPSTSRPSILNIAVRLFSAFVCSCSCCLWIGSGSCTDDAAGRIMVLPMVLPAADAFSLVMMGARRGRKKGSSLKRTLEGGDSAPATSSQQRQQQRSLNRGKGQEITGVSLPAGGKVKGWEFGEGVRMACANVGGRYYALEGQCPRCGFDLWKGDLLVDDPGFDDLPRLACPTCGTTYAMSTGKRGPPVKRTGLQGFVGNLAKSATLGDASKDAKSFMITRDEDGRVYCRER